MTVEELEGVGLNPSQFHADHVAVHVALKDQSIIRRALEGETGTPTPALALAQYQNVPVKVD